MSTIVNGAVYPILEQDFGKEPLNVRDTEHYQKEYVLRFVEKWDELIDWEARAKSEGRFFVEILKGREKVKILDVATGTGFHSVQLLKAGFDVTSADGNSEMLTKAFENARNKDLMLQPVHADWRWLNKDVHGKYDAIVCLGNSFTHLFNEGDRRRALAEFYAALKYDGVLIIDQRNYDSILDEGFSSKHTYYYCGDQVTAEPEHIDESLARFRYSFPDGSEFHLNMFPLRKAYMRGLLKDSGFQQVKTYGDFQETAWRMGQQIRILMTDADGFEVLRGHVELDESYVGGVRHGGKRGRGAEGKTIVMGLKERDGRMTTQIIPNVKMSTLRNVTLRNVEPGSTVSTDELMSYGLLTGDGYKHGSVKHGAKEYSRYDYRTDAVHHVNHVESFWRLFKKSVASTHIHVSPKYMDRYLSEFTFRSNHRKMENAMFDLLIGAV